MSTVSTAFPPVSADEAQPAPASALRQTPLNALHKDLGAKLVPFAGYEMPVQYPTGIAKEHLHVREAAGLFDVSHMGQALLDGPDFDTTALALEALTPGDILGLKPGQMRYTQLLNDSGGIIDDLMVTRPASGPAGRLKLVINASRKEIDVAHIAARLPGGVRVALEEDRALVALQGPQAADVLSRFAPGVSGLPFLFAADMMVEGAPVSVSRSGYTGEDGFEIAVDAGGAVPLARTLLADPRVLPIGLGARDTLRLEAGLCLYGQDMDESVSPVEAGLLFSIGKRRRREGGFPGADRIRREIEQGPPRIRCGLVLAGRAAARQGTELRANGGAETGIVTSGAFTPSAGKSIAMGFLPPAFAAPGTPVEAVIRGASHAAGIVSLPFVPHRYIRKPS